MNRMQTTFPNVVDWLSDYLAEAIPDLQVDSRWPELSDNPPVWAAIRDDGITRIDDFSGQFSGAVTVQAETETESSALADRVAVLVEASPFDADSPVLDCPSMQRPWPVQDSAHGVVYFMPLNLVITSIPVA